MIKKLSLVIILILLGCEKIDSFWYPYKLLKLTCSSYTGNVYLMKHSTGWRSWPYYIDIESKNEIEIPYDCIKETLKVFKISNKRNNLTYLQKHYLIEGKI